MKSRLVSLMGVWLLATTLHAQTLVNILDTLKDANGSNAAGRLVISWDQFTTAAGVTIDGGTLTYTITAGVVNLNLTPNIGAAPAGTSYRARYFLTNGASYTETWVVPAAGPVTIAAIRVSSIPSPNVLVSPTLQLSSSGAAGLCLVSNGTTAVWAPCVNVAPNKEFGFSGAASFTVTAAEHGFGHRKLVYTIRDNSGNDIEPGSCGVNQTTFDVTCAFQTAQSGTVVINGSAGLTKSTVSFTAQTSVTIPSVGGTVVLVACRDNSLNPVAVEPESWSVNGTTFVVTVTFLTPQSGTCTAVG